MNTRTPKGPTALDTLALSQTALVAVLLAIQFVPQPYMSSGVAAQGGQPYGVPLVSFLVLAFSLPTGYCMLLGGALCSAWQIRASVVILVTGLLAIRPVTWLTGSGSGGSDRVATWLSAAQVVVLAAFWLWAGIVTARERRAVHGDGQVIRPQSGRRVMLRALFLLLVYYGLQFGIWLTFVQAGQASAGSGILLSSIGAEILLLPLVLVFPILAFSTDWVIRAQEVDRSRPLTVLLVQVSESCFRDGREDSSVCPSSDREQVRETLDGLFQKTALRFRDQDQAIAVSSWVPREIHVGHHNDQG